MEYIPEFTNITYDKEYLPSIMEGRIIDKEYC